MLRHVEHLRQTFTLLKKRNLTLGSKKSFIEYSNRVLLSQIVDQFEIYIIKKKIMALTFLKFPTTLKKLETYISLSSYLRGYCPFYAPAIKPLQDLKTTLLKKYIKNSSTFKALNKISYTEKQVW